MIEEIGNDGLPGFGTSVDLRDEFLVIVGREVPACLAVGEVLSTLRKTMFWIASAPSDGHRGNIDRARFFVDLLREKAIPIGFDEVILDADAAHTWHFADRFLMRFLERTVELSDPSAEQKSLS